VGLRSRLFALTYNRQVAKVEKAGLGEMRGRLLSGASGRVLEIGGGTGANLAHYGPDVDSLTVTEPYEPMLRRLRRRAAEEAPKTEVVEAPAEELPFEDGSFDTAVSTLVLCGVSDQARSLAELRRVLRPGGRLLFLEHVRSDDSGLARKQDRLNFLNRFVACCDCNRATLAAIEAAGFQVDEVEHSELPKTPSFVRPLIVGKATSS
jgi:ubiquinone/menaquinone biosynthesis C-methylase UbiE